MINQLVRLSGRGVADLFLHPVAQLLTLVAVAMVTLLTGLILTGLHNVNLELIKNRGQVEFQIYWKTGLNEQAVQADWETISSFDHLKNFKSFTPQDGLTELASTLGEKGDFSWLAENNPLPYSALAGFAVPPEAQQEGWAPRLLKRIKALSGVDKVTYAPFQSELAQGWTTLTKAVFWPVMGFLALIIALVVHNTIKLSLYTRMDEVEILSLVGAKPGYIRWPLLTGGFIQGVLGSGLGVGLLILVHSFIADAFNFAPLFLQVQLLPVTQMLALCGAVTFVSMASSWVAVK